MAQIPMITDLSVLGVLRIFPREIICSIFTLIPRSDWINVKVVSSPFYYISDQLHNPWDGCGEKEFSSYLETKRMILFVVNSPKHYIGQALYGNSSYGNSSYGKSSYQHSHRHVIPTSGHNPTERIIKHANRLMDEKHYHRVYRLFSRPNAIAKLNISIEKILQHSDSNFLKWLVDRALTPPLLENDPLGVLGEKGRTDVLKLLVEHPIHDLLLYTNFDAQLDCIKAAIKAQHFDMVVYLLGLSTILTSIDTCPTALHELAQTCIQDLQVNEELYMLQRIMCLLKALPPKKYFAFQTIVFIEACILNQTECVRWMVETLQHDPQDAKNKALRKCIRAKTATMAIFLLKEFKVDPNIHGNNSIFQLSIICDVVPVIEYLLQDRRMFADFSATLQYLLMTFTNGSIPVSRMDTIALLFKYRKITMVDISQGIEEFTHRFYKNKSTHKDVNAECLFKSVKEKISVVC